MPLDKQLGWSAQRRPPAIPQSIVDGTAVYLEMQKQEHIVAAVQVERQLQMLDGIRVMPRREIALCSCNCQ